MNESTDSITLNPNSETSAEVSTKTAGQRKRKARGSNKMPGRHRCSPRAAKAFRVSARILSSIVKRDLNPAEKGAIAYLGEPLTREDNGNESN